ncbi:hypothetical protein GCM10010862_09330 [Devosia nitrariae]|uniref:Type II toxin-antitoxin system RelE/ParE family toxin n=1 Tax=Devosia nitrariae TaxID=2071872 RepID=A0ABQ5W1B9_9HYPH|nr:hypothetical protein GCM10010862_09330 [Devosia nitrariae]
MATESPYKLSPAPESDLSEIWRYTARKWSREQADSYHDQFAAFEGLAAGIKKGPHRERTARLSQISGGLASDLLSRAR